MSNSITRDGSEGSFTYSVNSGLENRPVVGISWFNALRYANWLHNGQPTGEQDTTATEDGAYTFSGLMTVGTRNAGATIFLTSEDEWYKAAYYDALSTSYFEYPAGTDVTTICAMPGTTPNTANCSGSAGDLTDVGSYTDSASPYGTYDQGGNVWEWNESAVGESSNRGIRGGAWGTGAGLLGASHRGEHGPGAAADIGFRVTMIPEPSTALLVALGLVGIAAGRRRCSTRWSSRRSCVASSRAPICGRPRCGPFGARGRPRSPAMSSHRVRKRNQRLIYWPKNLENERGLTIIRRSRGSIPCHG